MRPCLQGQSTGLLDDAVISGLPLWRGVGHVHRRHDLARQRRLAGTEQVDRDRAVAQQLPVKRREERALERRLMLDLLEQQVRLHLQHVLQNVILQVVTPGHLGRHLHAGGTQCVCLGFQLFMLSKPISLPLRLMLTGLQQPEFVQ
ncbi:hypothetical protein D9M71_262350 [compost metagenome]